MHADAFDGAGEGSPVVAYVNFGLFEVKGLHYNQVVQR